MVRVVEHEHRRLSFELLLNGLVDPLYLWSEQEIYYPGDYHLIYFSPEGLIQGAFLVVLHYTLPSCTAVQQHLYVIIPGFPFYFNGHSAPLSPIRDSLLRFCCATVRTQRFFSEINKNRPQFPAKLVIFPPEPDCKRACRICSILLINTPDFRF